MFVALSASLGKEQMIFIYPLRTFFKLKEKERKKKKQKKNNNQKQKQRPINMSTFLPSFPNTSIALHVPRLYSVTTNCHFPKCMGVFSHIRFFFGGGFWFFISCFFFVFVLFFASIFISGGISNERFLTRFVQRRLDCLFILNLFAHFREFSLNLNLKLVQVNLKLKLKFGSNLKNLNRLICWFVNMILPKETKA